MPVTVIFLMKKFVDKNHLTATIKTHPKEADFYQKDC